MKKLLGFLIVFLCASVQGSYAQTLTGQIIAAQYQYLVQGYSPNTYVFPPATCTVAGPKKELAFFTNAPIKIVDGDPALNEFVTPSNVIFNNQTCSLSIAPLNSHQSPFSLVSGTGGLQEAIDLNTSNQQKNTIILDNDWYQMVGGATAGAAIIAAAKGTYNLSLQDVTQAPNTFYQWNGTQYIEVTIAGQAISTYTTPGLVPGGVCYVYPGSVTSDAFAAINACGLTLPATGGVIDATGLGSANYVVTTPLTATNHAAQQVSLKLNPNTTFTINTVLTPAVATPANAAVQVGQGSSIIVPGYIGTTPNFALGPLAQVHDVISNGDFTGLQQTMRLDGVSIQGNTSATVGGALLHLQGLQGISTSGITNAARISNSFTSMCFAQCVQIDAASGGAATLNGRILLDNDFFTDGATTGTYPGSVVNIDALSAYGSVVNLTWIGGGILYNGPHNQLLTINGRGSFQLDSIQFINTNFTTSVATGSTFNTNVDPIQITDAAQVYFSNMHVTGNINTAAQASLLDIFAVASNQDYGINVQGIEASTAPGFTRLINNTAEGTSETGYPNGNGDTVLPNYIYGQVVPQVRQTNAVPPTNVGQCVIGSLWTNSNGTGTTNTVYACEGAPGSQTYVPLGSSSSGVASLNGLMGVLSLTQTGGVAITTPTSSQVNLQVTCGGTLANCPSTSAANSFTAVNSFLGLTAGASGVTSPTYQFGTTASGNYGLLSPSDHNGTYPSLQLFGTCNGCGTTVDTTGVYAPNFQTGGNTTTGTLVVSGPTTFSLLQNGVSGQPITVNQNGGGSLAMQLNAGLGITGPISLPSGAGTSGQVLTSGGTGQPLTWSSGGGGSITALTGDVMASGSGSVASTVRGLNGVSLSSLNGLLQDSSGTISAATGVNVSGNGQFGGYVASGSYIVPCTTTPVFDLSQGNFQVLTLTTACGTVTSSSVANLPSIIDDARHVTIRVCQDSTGGHTFPDPTWANGWNSPTLLPSQCTDTIYTATSTGMVVDGYNAAFCAVSGTSPLACGHAVKGYVTAVAGTNPTVTVNTTAVGPMSIIFADYTTAIGTSVTPAVTCNSTLPTAKPYWNAAGSGSNFTITVPGTFTGNPICLEYVVINP